MTESTLNKVRTGLRWLSAVSPEGAAEAALQLFTRPKKHERPNWEKERIQNSRSVALASGLKTQVWGRSEKKILLVHGWEGRGAQLAALVPPLLERGREVIAFDGPAHGDSPGKRTNINRFTNALLEVAKEQGPFEAVIAHSFGAAATALSLSRGLEAERVVLVAGPSNVKTVIDHYSQTMKFTAQVDHIFRRRLESWAGIEIEKLDIRKLAISFTTPALIVHDPDDREVAFRHAEEIVAKWPGAKLFAPRDLGHRRILKAPVFVEAVLQFLDEKDASR